MKEFISFVELRQLFPYMAFVYAWIVPLWADQLLLQLLMEQFDTLPIQCRHIEHMHEGVFSLTLTVRGVSNKHCLLTFFILSIFEWRLKTGYTVFQRCHHSAMQFV